MKGWRERAADVFAEQGSIAAKMKSAPGPGTTDLGYSTTPQPTKGVRPRARLMWSHAELHGTHPYVYCRTMDLFRMS